MDQSTIHAIQKAMAFELKRKETPPEGFPALPEIPGKRYTDQSFFDLETKFVWRKSWVCVGRERDVLNPGDFKCFDKLGAPMIIVRGRDSILRAFYNTCRHRGARLTTEGFGNTKLLRCPYHSWSYGLDGALKGVPDQRDFSCLNKVERGLIEIRCEVWNGLIFLTENLEAPPLLSALGGIVDDFSTIDIARLRKLESKELLIDCNWKAALDAFLEVYHVKTIHRETVGSMLDDHGAVMTLYDHGHSRMVTPRNKGDNVVGKDVNFSSYNEAPYIDTMSDAFKQYSMAYHIFPNLIMPIDKVGFPLMLFWPRGKSQCSIEIIYLGPDWGSNPRPPFWEQYLETFNKVVDEDVQFLASIQDSLDSGAFTGMMLNYQERRIYWFHEEIDRRVGAENIPQELAVKKKLKNYITVPLNM